MEEKLTTKMIKNIKQKAKDINKEDFVVINDVKYIDMRRYLKCTK